VNAITIRLPYAAAIRASAKLVENRGRPIHDRHIGERVAIHAAATWSKEGGADPRIRQWWWGPGCREVVPTDFSFMFRKVIAVATIAGCHEAQWPRVPMEACCAPWGDSWYSGKPAWHIVLADVVALDEPVGPVRGQLSVPWNLPDDVAAQVAEQIGVAS
jgi:hypothetical protein